MKKILCIAQEDMLGIQKLKNLEIGLKDILKYHYKGKQQVVVLWMVMPRGYAYSERKLSQAMIIMVEVDEGTVQEKREDLMERFSRFLMEGFDLSPLDTLITVADSSFVDQFFEAQRKRIQTKYRLMVTLKMIWTAMRTRLTDGYFKLMVRGHGHQYL